MTHANAAPTEGYVGGGKRSAPANAAPPVGEPKPTALGGRDKVAQRKEAQRKEAGDQAVPAWQYSTAAAAPEDLLAAMKRAPEADTAEPVQPVAAAQPGAVSAIAARPTLEAPRTLNAAPYTVQLLPGSEMNVRVDNYSCTVPIAPDDAFQLLGLSATPAGEQAAQAPAARQDGAPNPAPSPVSPEEAAKAGVATRKTADATAAALSPEARRAVLRMVRERYRAVIEARCGPLPR